MICDFNEPSLVITGRLQYTQIYIISGMLGQFPVITGGTANDSIHAITTESKNSVLIVGDTTGWVSVSLLHYNFILPHPNFAFFGCLNEVK